MTEISIGGRNIPLVFNYDAWAEMEETVCKLANLDEVLNSDNRAKEPAEKTNDSKARFARLLAVLGNQGLEMDGKERDLTEKWVRKNIRPAQYVELKMAVIREIDDGMRMETETKDPNAPRDLVLEEIDKKKQ